MPSLILHIGSAKTGTTSIQQFLAQNREALLARRVVVPSFLGVGPNHRWLHLLAQDGGTVDGFMTRQGLHASPERLRQALAAKRMELEQAASVTPDTSWIISSEHLHARLSTVDLMRLRRLLEPLFAEIRVVVYVRQAMPTAISAWSTRSRGGRVMPGLEPPQSFARLCDHAAPLHRWQQVFGRQRLQVRRFHPADLRGGSLLEDFCSCAGIGSLSGLCQPAPVNRSLSYQAIKVLWHLQERWRSPAQGPPAPGWRWPALVRFVERSLSGFPTYIPTAKERDHFASHYAASEGWLCREFFPERARLWEPEELPVREEGDPRFLSALTAEESALVAMVAELWREGGDSSGES
ncbi:MAG: hypothetical protein ACKOZW_07250 [Cyanobium sp.]